jgi:hypothetical protein
MRLADNYENISQSSVRINPPPNSLVSEIEELTPPLFDLIVGSVGDTPVTRHVKGPKNFNSRSVENMLKSTLERVLVRCGGLSVKTDTVTVMRSLILPFLARMSTRDNWIEDANECERMERSFADALDRLVTRTEQEGKKVQTYVKYFLDTYLARVFEDSQRPPRPEFILDGDSLFSGWLRRFVLRAIARGDAGFIYSLQKGAKQSWPELPEYCKEEALRKHMLRFSTHHGLLPKDIADQLSATCSKVLGGIEIAELKKFMPSGSACIQNSRRDGGSTALFSSLVVPPSVSASFSTDTEDVFTLDFSGVHDVHRAASNWRRDTFLQACRAVDESTFVNSFDELGYHNTPVTRLEIVAIAEPSKFRIISKGDGNLYTALQPLQGAMLDRWKHTSFSTMLHDDLTERVDRMYQDTPKEFLWCSVDYEAATDLLKKHVTVIAVSSLGPCPHRDLALLSIAPGIAKYTFLVPGSDPPEFTEEFIRHIDGQPMGHPLSFPILCLVNLAVYQTALSRWRAVSILPPSTIAKYARIMERNVLVNGDDMLFRGPREFYDIFILCAADAGLKISLGKNYLSPHTCMINSQLFRVISGEVRKIGYLNQRLTFGFGVKKGESNATPVQISRAINKMVHECPWSACTIPLSLSRFSHLQGKSGLPGFVPNWYLPVHLGGYGIDICFAPNSLTVTKRQREVAAQFANDPTLQLFLLECSQDKALVHDRLRRCQLDLMRTTSKFRFIHPKVHYVANSNERTSDPWVGRSSYLSRIMNLDLMNSLKVDIDFTVVVKLLPKKQYWVRPMSDRGLARHWIQRLLTEHIFPVPAFPPLPDFRFSNLLPLLRIAAHHPDNPFDPTSEVLFHALFSNFEDVGIIPE